MNVNNVWPKIMEISAKRNQSFHQLQRLTALVVLGIRDRDTFPLIFYRENCADMAVDEADFDEAFIASSKALLITGTQLSSHAAWSSSLIP